MYDIEQLKDKLLPELKEIAKDLKIEKVDNLKKQELVYKILDHQASNPEAKAAQKKESVERKPQKSSSSTETATAERPRKRKRISPKK